MIRVDKPTTPPRILHDEAASGPKATEAMKKAYDAGERKFEFKSSIYAAKSVKSQLIKAQHGKCCFCESCITHIDYGDVEHFRPKSAFRQKSSDPLEKPGYYWLAYRWENLFLSCALCNQRFKACLFPLKTQSKRARSHHDELGDEEPLLTHPADDEPSDYLEFVAEVVRARRRSRKGRETIDVLGLNRPELQERRRDRLRDVGLSQRTVRVLTKLQDQLGTLTSDQLSLLQDHQQTLHECTQPESEYSAMARAALA